MLSDHQPIVCVPWLVQSSTLIFPIQSRLLAHSPSLQDARMTDFSFMYSLTKDHTIRGGTVVAKSSNGKTLSIADASYDSSANGGDDVNAKTVAGGYGSKTVKEEITLTPTHLNGMSARAGTHVYFLLQSKTLPLSLGRLL